MKASNITILTTQDYSIFNTQEGNRDLLNNDIKKIEKKILGNNLLKYHPILVSSDFKVIDGQHRLEVAKRNKLEIYFIIMKEKSSLKTTQSVNTTGKPWQVKDFLKSYIALGNPEYIKFNEYLHEYTFLTISQLIELSTSIKSGGRQASEIFRDGDLTFSDHDTLIRNLNSINNYINTSMKIAKSTHFQRFIFLSDKRGIVFDHKRMVKKIDANAEIVKRIPNDCYMYADLLGDIYNHKLSKVNKVNFNLRLIK